MALISSAPEVPPRRRILIVDDHALVRRGLTALIANEADLLVCAEVATEREGLDAIPVSKPDLVIADLSLQDCESLDMVKAIRLRHDGLPVLLLSMHDAPICAERALQAGASGYVTKQEMGEIVLLAIRCVLDGGTYLSPKIRAALARR